MNQSDIQFRASEAERLSTEPLLKEALAKMEAQAIDAMLSGPAEDREEARLTAKIIRDFREALRGMILDNNDAQHAKLTVV